MSAFIAPGVAGLRARRNMRFVAASSSALLALALASGGCGSAGSSADASRAGSAGSAGSSAGAGPAAGTGGSVVAGSGAGGSSAGSAGSAPSGTGGDSGSGGAPAGGNAGVGGAASAMWTTNGTKYSLTFGNTYFEVDAGLGGRITSFKTGGSELLADAKATGLDDYWGSTFWPSPQTFVLPPSDPTIANIDRNPYTAKLEGNVLSLSGLPTEGKRQLSVVKKFSADVAKEAIVIEYTMTNAGPTPVDAAPWEVTRVVGGGLTFYPENTPPVVYGQNSMPPTTLANGVRWFQHVVTVKDATKFFADGKDGWISHVTGPNKDLLLIKTFPDITPAQSPTGESEVEIYAVPTYVEVEQQGAVQTLAAGESSASWTVRWYGRKLAAPAAIGSADLVTYVQNQIK